MTKSKRAELKKDKSYFTRFHLPKNHGNVTLLPDGTVLKTAMRVKTLKESVESCKPAPMTKSKSRLFTFRRSSLRTSLTEALRMSLKASSSNKSRNNETSAAAMTESSTTHLMEKTSKVSFGQSMTRSYHIEVDDNPGVSGKGPAIHLSWKYDQEEAVSVDEYEAARPEPRKVKDLKMNLIERERLLMESGASRRELQAFALRIKKAKAKRAATVEELSLYGKANMAKAEMRMEKWEGFTQKVQRVLHLRRTDTSEQKHLWKKLQKEGQPRQRSSAAIATQ